MPDYEWYEWFTATPWLEFKLLIFQTLFFLSFVTVAVISGALVWHQAHKTKQGVRRHPRTAGVSVVIIIVLLIFYYVHAYRMILASFWIPWVAIAVGGIILTFRRGVMGYYIGIGLLFGFGTWWILDYYALIVQVWPEYNSIWDIFYWWW